MLPDDLADQLTTTMSTRRVILTKGVKLAYAAPVVAVSMKMSDGGTAAQVISGVCTPSCTGVACGSGDGCDGICGDGTGCCHPAGTVGCTIDNFATFCCTQGCIFDPPGSTFGHCVQPG
jgi:hypothetical protein